MRPARALPRPSSAGEAGQMLDRVRPEEQFLGHAGFEQHDREQPGRRAAGHALHRASIGWPHEPIHSRGQRRNSEDEHDTKHAGQQHHRPGERRRPSQNHGLRSQLRVMAITVPASSNSIPWPSSTAVDGRSGDCRISGARTNLDQERAGQRHDQADGCGQVNGCGRGGGCHSPHCAIATSTPDADDSRARPQRTTTPIATSQVIRTFSSDAAPPDPTAAGRNAARFTAAWKTITTIRLPPVWLNSQVNNTDRPIVQPMNPPIAKTGLVPGSECGLIQGSC